jgi:CheY-like chemotaxis protein
MSERLALPSVLLVEDSPDDTFFFQRALEKAAIEASVEIAEDGARAIDYLSRGGPIPEIMFVDLKMPNVNGFELLQWLQTQPFRSQIRIVILTSSEEPREMQSSRALGAAAFITKPVSAARLRQEIELVWTNGNNKQGAVLNRPNSHPDAANQQIG